MTGMEKYWPKMSSTIRVTGVGLLGTFLGHVIGYLSACARDRRPGNDLQ